MNYLGRVTLTPQTDDWIDVETRPDLVVRIDNAGEIADNQEIDLGTVWDDWQTTWTGRPVPVAGQNGQWKVSRQWQENLAADGRCRAGCREYTESTRLLQTDFRQVRSGLRSTLVAEESSVFLGKRVIDTTLIPYMRAVNINFKGDGFRPLTRLYPFFDNTPVSSFITVDGVTSSGPFVTDSAGRIGYDKNLIFHCPPELS